MSTTILTSAWDAIILNFSPVFTQPTTQIFISLITGWILCTKRRTITGILPFADPKNKRPHDAYHRLFPKSRWLPALKGGLKVVERLLGIKRRLTDGLST